MNLRGPISQKQFLYVGYTHLEWLLVPPGPQHTTHIYWRWPMKYRTPFIGHMLFIYFYLSPVAFSLSPPRSTCLGLCLSHSCFSFLFFLFHSLLFSSHHAKLQEVANEKEITFYRTHTVLFISAGCSLRLCLSFFHLSLSLCLLSRWEL